MTVQTPVIDLKEDAAAWLKGREFAIIDRYFMDHPDLLDCADSRAAVGQAIRDYGFIRGFVRPDNLKD